MIEFKILTGGKWHRCKNSFPVFNPYNGDKLGEVPEISRKEFDSAVEAAELGFQEMKRLPACERASILVQVAENLERQKDEFAKTISLESGKAIKYSRGEVVRAIENLRFSAETLKHFEGRVPVSDSAKGGINKTMFYKRFPRGVIAAITPFNFPLNLVIHKIAPALGSGNSVILKPSSFTPITAIKLCELFLETSLPRKAISLVTGPGQLLGEWITSSRGINMITFTGSVKVGKWIKNNAGMKHVTLELGSNSPLIIDGLPRDSNLISRLITGIFANSGQVCISTQRIYIHEDLYDKIKDDLVKQIKKINIGDPLEENVEYGPLITEREAIRVENLINEALSGGARLITGGKRYKSMIEPCLIDNITEDMKIYNSEVFGPVACLIPYSNFSEIINRVNRSKFGLNAGVITPDLDKAFQAYQELETGTVIINDIPTWRVDQMPYGGMKLSGTGREGPRFAMEEMTEIKLMVINHPNIRENCDA